MATNSNTRFVLGIKFDTIFEMSEVILKGSENKPMQPEAIFLQDVIINHEKSGRVDVKVIPKGRATGDEQQTRNEDGNYLGELVDDQALVESGQGRFNIRGKSEGLQIHIKSDSHLPTRVSTISIRGNSVTRKRPV